MACNACLSLDLDPVKRALAYQAWLLEGVNSEDLDRIRTHLQKERALGDRTFQAMIEKHSANPPQPARAGDLGGARGKSSRLNYPRPLFICP